MKCLVLVSFAGMVYSGARGKEIDLPLHEAKSLEASGIVQILEDFKPEVAYETAEAAMGETAVKKVGRTKK